ncbi:SusE domain-containing protein [Aridibaculum aurantiacum]|uniref:SusE domain-containing protein n=1 Tax=Aridibaculum aurantiacum TaxID=2810307 RepID=UPI001A962CD8|nr:SusE domain-containing protein [Aridibaculum aurantiacum]
MKRYMNWFFSAALTLVVLAGCKKEENRVVLQGGTAPKLTATVTANKVLTAARKDEVFAQLNWTNPDYMFNTGVSSHNVTYHLQVDTVGANFTNPEKVEIAISNDLSRTVTVAMMNNYLTRMRMVAEIPHNIEIRIASSINGTARLFSNAIQITGVVPYEDFAVPPPTSNELYMTGDATASGWTNSPPAAQKLTRVDRGEYFIITQLSPGTMYKFLSHPGQWQPQYGGSSATGGDIGVNLGGGSDPDAIPTPGDAGTYKITLNFRTGKYTVVKQ